MLLSPLLLSGCMMATVQEERVDLVQSATPYEICKSAGDPRMFAENRKKAAMQLVRERNYDCNWAAIDMYWDNFMSNAMAGMQYGLSLMQQGSFSSVGTNNQPTGSLYNGQRGVQDDGSISISGAGYLKRSIMDGQDRICYYEKLGKTSFVRIPSTQICPQMN